MKLFLSAAVWATALPSLCSAAFTWSNVKIGGGGGFVPGIVFNPTTKGVAYARTDIGGLYKLNSDDSWTALTDAITQSTSWHNWGIDAVATDPVDSKRVYIAVGMYTNSWDPDNGAILRSADSGATWQSTALSFKVGGNMPGRGMGERLAIDPQNNKIIYFGARSGNGLWKSVDQGVTFTKVTSFTAVGTYSQDPSDSNGYLNDIQGLAWITFDSTSGLTSGATSRIFVGVADKGNSVYVSTDAGSTWKAVTGQPTGNMPHKCKLQPTEKALYLTYSNTSGPYDGGTGTVQRYDLATSTWKDISPLSGSSLYFGYGGLGVDMQKPGTLVVASLNSWWPDAQLYRSNNSGASWSPIWEWTSYPSKNLYYGFSTSKAPWITADRAADDTKQLGWMIESLEIDPFDSNHWLYGTGLTVYGGHDLTNWDTKHNITIQSLADGIEEESVQDLASVLGGPALLAATGDVGGFTFKSVSDLKTAPAKGWLTPAYTSNTGVDYAGNKPASIVRCGNANDGTQQVAVSSDSGQTWSIDYGSQGGQYGGKIAYSADADTVLWSSASSGVLVSQYTNAFSAVSSLPSGAAIASDKRDGKVFYGGSGGAFYISKDTGKTFTKTVSLSGASAVRSIAVNPTLAGDVWVSTDAGVFHSTDSGSTFTKASTITSGYDITLGKGSGSYWNVYVLGSASGGDKLYASADQGGSWIDIQGTQGFGSLSANTITASPDTAGLVFVGTNGRGVFYAQGTVTGGSTPPATSSAGASTSSAPVSTSTQRTTSSSTLATSTKPVTSSSTTSRTSTVASPSATGQAVAKYGQCGGSSWTGSTTCVAGTTCQKQNDFYSQCL